MIPYGQHHLDDDDITAVVAVLKSRFLTQGPNVENFEAAVAKYVGAEYAVAVSSGTAGLHLAAIAAGVEPESVVVTSPLTFVASANAARYCGAEVAFSDISSRTLNMCPEALARILSAHSNVSAVIPVHFAGLPCDTKAISEICDRAGAVVIEDAAHALGATYENGQRVGSCCHSSMTVFSFHPVKAIAAGEGGMVTTNDPELYRRLLRLRSHGINKSDDALMVADQAYTDGLVNPWYYEMRELGFNYRITDIQSALARSQLTKLDGFIARRRELAARYNDAFRSHPRLRPAQFDLSPHSALHLYVLRLDFAALGLSRAEAMVRLRDQGIGTQVHYMPVPMHPYYRRLGARPDDFPVALKYYEEALSIPLYYGLENEQQDFVIEQLLALA